MQHFDVKIQKAERDAIHIARKLVVQLKATTPPFLSSTLGHPLLLHCISYVWHRKAKALTITLLAGSATHLWLKWKAVRRDEKERARRMEMHHNNGYIPSVNLSFFFRLLRILKIMLPSIRSKEAVVAGLLTLLLIARSFLSIKIAEAMGYNAKCLVQRKLDRFIFGVVALGIIAVPTSLVNSGITYFTNILSLLFRRRLSRYVHSQYLSGNTFYRATLDENAIDNIDHRIAQDIERFSLSVASLYANVFRPAADLVVFTYKLSMLMGIRGPLILYVYYSLSSLLLRFVMPPFPKLSAQLQRLEGNFRFRHSRLISHAEEIAFYRGAKREKKLVNNCLDRVYSHASSISSKQAAVGMVDELLVKYGATMIGYSVIALPIFETYNRHRQLQQGASVELPFRELDSLESEIAASVTGDYVRNTQLLINLARAIGRLVMLHKELNVLAGYTARVAELLELLESMGQKYASAPKLELLAATGRNGNNEIVPASFRFRNGFRNGEGSAGITGDGEEEEDEGEDLRRAEKIRALMASRGEFVEGECISLEDVSVVTPDGMLLVEGLSFELPHGKNLLITGPNGCGKSSLFRVLNDLWPLRKGKVTRPPEKEILFIPQQPYLAIGTLRDQVIYPDSQQDMEAKGVADSELEKLMRSLNLFYLVQREGWDKWMDWNEALSGGEKQRIAMVRMLYHNPRFVIMDECTSAVSADVETFIYKTMKERRISCISVSHRRSTLWRFHEYLLQLYGDGTWEWKAIDHKKEKKNNY